MISSLKINLYWIRNAKYPTELRLRKRFMVFNAEQFDLDSIYGDPRLGSVWSFLAQAINLNEPAIPDDILWQSPEGVLIRVILPGDESLRYELSGQPIWLWLFPVTGSDQAASVVFFPAAGFSLSNEYALGGETTLASDSFWHGGWVLFCNQSGYVLPKIFLHALESESQIFGGLQAALAESRIQLSLGLNLIHQWSTQEALPGFNLKPFDHLLQNEPVLLLGSERLGGMNFSLMLSNTGTVFPHFITKFLNADWITINLFNAFADSPAPPYRMASFSTLGQFLEQEAIVEVNLPADTEHNAVTSVAIFPQSGHQLTQSNALSNLFTELGIEQSFDETLRFPDVPLHLLYLKFSVDDAGINAIQATITLAPENANAGWKIVEGLFVFYGISIDLNWRKGGGIDFVVEGAMKAFTYDFLLGFSYPANAIFGGLAPGTNTNTQIKELIRSTGAPEVVADALSVGATAFDLSMYVDVDDKELELRIQNHDTWHITDFVELDKLDLTIEFLDSWRFSGASLHTDFLLPIGEVTTNGREDVAIEIAADFDKSLNLWTFEGNTESGQDIQVGEVINALVSKLGSGSPNEQLPEDIQSLAVKNLHLYFDSEGNADFTCETTLEIEGVELDFWVHLKRESKALFLAGSIFIDGFQLGVVFAKKKDESGTSNKTTVGSLQTKKLMLNSSELVAVLAPDLADDVPLEVDIQLLGLLLGMHAGSSSPREYLFRISFVLDIGLDKFPLIGHMLSSVKFNNGQLLAANRAWEADDIDTANSLIEQFPEPPKHIEGPKNAQETGGIGKGISLSGRFELTEDLGFPLFLNFGGDKRQKQLPAKSNGKGSGSKEKKGNRGETTKPESSSSQNSPAKTESKPDARSQSKVDKVISAVRVKKVALIFEDGRIGLKLTGGLALVVFEFELMGMQVTVPQSVLNDPSLVTEIAFDLDGMGAKIQKGTLSIMGAFLRMHYDDNGGYDEYNGIVQVAFPPFMLTGMGSYAKFSGHPSLFLFAAIGFPIPVTSAVVIQGLAFGFGIHRDFVLPEIDEVLSYPLIQVSVTPPPEIDIQDMAEKMHKYFPPTEGAYFVVAGIKFRVFGLINTVAMLAVKIGRAFEIDLIGISSILYPSAFIELAWEARFVPAEGYILVRGQLTSRSYLYIPPVNLIGGFAVAAWALGVHQGDFVATMGGYHAHYRVPAHYPDHVPRLGISFHLDPITVKGGVYFAITPQLLMLGGFLQASLEASFDAKIVSASFHAAISLAIDALINFEPFHYDLMVAADATLDASLSFTFYTKHIHHHLHFDAHIWGPDFSGTASLDVGPKTFDLEFGAAGRNRALPIGWDAFSKKFLGVESTGEDKVLGITVTQGLLQKVKEGETEVYVVDPKRVVIEVNSLVPITNTEGITLAEPAPKPNPGIAPMDIRGGRFTATFTPPNLSEFAVEPVWGPVPKGIWGDEGLKKPDISSGADGLMKNVLTGFRFTPSKGAETTETHSVNKSVFAYNIDEFSLAEKASTYTMTELETPEALAIPTNEYDSFTGLGELTLTQVDPGTLLHTHLTQFQLTPAE